MYNIASLFAIGMPSGWEWIVILAIAVLIFGRRLPDIARSIAKSLTEFKKGVHDVSDDVNKTIDESDQFAKKKNETDDKPKE